ncbi:MAG TPA: LLM class F420-dependent oxidoreductase [Acidimicrobiales bacterium]|jgi:F420-dependent oxidoreductase-like protein|nr:LLM class F420-dependent oxidoreductase [Acidimicrobiales bacterium]
MIRMGLQIPNFTYPGVPAEQLFERVSDIAVTAEESGFDSVWVMDHFFQLPLLGPPSNEMFEAYTLLGALAARTRRVRLGAMVTGVTYRNPSLLAKQVTALDVISQGRAILGIGAAWFDVEHAALGFDYPSTKERLDRLEEAVQVCRAMFTQDVSNFEGQYYRLVDAFNSPRPVQPGGPPILIGGSGEKRTLRLVAQYADACNIFGDTAGIRHLVGVIERHCADFGRNPDEITKTRLGTLILGADGADAEARFTAMLSERGVDLAALPEETAAGIRARVSVGGPDEIGEEVQQHLAAGLDGVIFNMPDAHDLDRVRFAGEVLQKALASA